MKKSYSARESAKALFCDSGNIFQSTLACRDLENTAKSKTDSLGFVESFYPNSSLLLKFLPQVRL